MKTTGIIVDNWKVPIFKSHLAQEGYKYIEDYFTPSTTILKVELPSMQAAQELNFKMNQLARDYRTLHPEVDDN